MLKYISRDVHFSIFLRSYGCFRKLLMKLIKYETYIKTYLIIIENRKSIMSRKLSEAAKKRIAGNQHYKCANKPGANLKGLGQYSCPLWKIKNKTIRGSFDAAGYDIDHIVEYSITQDDSDDNLQALCLNCHRSKTVDFIIEKSKKNSTKSIYIDSRQIIESLKSIKMPMDTQYREIYAEYDKIYSEYDEIFSSYKDIYAEYKDIYAEYKGIYAEYEGIYAEYDNMYAEYDNIQL